MSSTHEMDLLYPLYPVEMLFECVLPPELRQADLEWHLSEFTLQERLNRPYELKVIVATNSETLDPRQLVGLDARIRFGRDIAPRTVHGIIAWADLHPDLPGVSFPTAFQLMIVPALDALRYTQLSRTWTDRTAVEILDELLREQLSPYKRTYRIDLLVWDAYPTRKYCVQYNESNLAFIHRLCEEEGLIYFFDHQGASESLVIAAAGNWMSMPEVTLHPNSEGTIWVVSRNAEHARQREIVSALEIPSLLGPTRFERWDFDWTRYSPAHPMTLEPYGRSALEQPTAARDIVDAQGRERVMFEHSRATSVGEQGYTTTSASVEGGGSISSQPSSDEVTRQNTLSRNREMVRQRTVRGQGNVVGFMPGSRGALLDRQRTDHRLLLTEVRHHGRNQLDVTARSSSEYGNTFSAIPVEVDWCPPLETPKPRIHGFVSAVVTDPNGTENQNGDEVNVDGFGRVPVHFHWDGRRDASSVVFVRVMQSWAGAGYGSWFLPRRGMEVAVSFLEGDPDRPMITGCLYNSHNPPPYLDSEGATHSVIRTQSVNSKRDGYNELRFQDREGAEEVFLRAQRTLRETVLNDHVVTTGGKHEERIGGGRESFVTASDYLELVAEKDESVKKTKYEVRAGAARIADHDSDWLVSTGRDKRGDAYVVLGCGTTSLILTPSTIALSADKITIDGREFVSLDVPRGGTIEMSHSTTPGNSAALLDLTIPYRPMKQGIAIESHDALRVYALDKAEFESGGDTMVIAPNVKLNAD